MPKTLYVGDLHGDLQAFDAACSLFQEEKYDKIVFMGDYVDSLTKNDLDILYLMDELIEFKKENYEKTTLLLGNHEMHYYFTDNWWKCPGFRTTISFRLRDLFEKHRVMFKVAEANGSFLATHAGINERWWIRYSDRLMYLADTLGVTDPMKEIDIILNALLLMKDSWILGTRSPFRGASPQSYPGPFWMDRSEVKKLVPIPRYTQIVGHSPVKEITKDVIHMSNSSTGIIKAFNFIYVDCLGEKQEFFTLNN